MFRANHGAVEEGYLEGNVTKLAQGAAEKAVLQRNMEVGDRYFGCFHYVYSDSRHVTTQGQIVYSARRTHHPFLYARCNESFGAWSCVFPA